MRRPWLRHGFWNTLEQAVTRIGDALTAFVLIWFLQPELFSELAVAQAWAAPTLLLFLTPEGSLYRDLAGWKQLGSDHVAASLRALRLFAWSKVLLALAASLVLALALPVDSGYPSRFAAVLWGYSLIIGTQVGGPDREFLRLELRLRVLNLLTILQKTIQLGGTLGVTLLAGGRFGPLAAVCWAAGLVTAFLAYRLSLAVLRGQGASSAGLRGLAGPPARQTLARTLATFTIWQHLSTAAASWVRTMDLFFLGLFRFPARALGLYGAAIKVANLTTALPTAVVNLVAIWLGRRSAEGPQQERRSILRMSVALLLATALTALVLAVLLPVALELLSHGRWSAGEVATTRGWVHWLLLVGVVQSGAVLVVVWLGLRTSYARLFFRVFVPWTISGLLLFGVAAGLGGPDATARIAVVVSGILVLLTLHRFRRVR